MKRHFFKIALFVFAGAIINVAVAWGCAILGVADQGVVAREVTEDEATYWATRVPGNWHFIPRAIAINVGIGITEFTITNPAGALLVNPEPQIWNGGRASVGSALYGIPAGGTGRDKVIRIHVGWPSRTLVGECWFGSPEVQTPRNIGNHCRGAYLLNTSRGVRIMPLGVIWPGLAINTIFYAAIVWFLFFAPGAIRRRVRGKRGQCAACGYSLRGRGTSTNVCPECGSAAHGAAAPCNPCSES